MCGMHERIHGSHASIQRMGARDAQRALIDRLITSAIVGPRTVEQMIEYVGSLDHAFAAEDEALVDSMVPVGHPSTPGYSDPAYPVEGRQPRTE